MVIETKKDTKIWLLIPIKTDDYFFKIVDISKNEVYNTFKINIHYCVLVSLKSATRACEKEV